MPAKMALMAFLSVGQGQRHRHENGSVDTVKERVAQMERVALTYIHCRV